MVERCAFEAVKQRSCPEVAVGANRVFCTATTALSLVTRSASRGWNTSLRHPARWRHGHRQSHGPGGDERLDQCRGSAPDQRGQRVRPDRAVEQHQLMPSRFRIDWVLVDELAIGPAPRATRQLDRLQEQRIKAVLTLCSEEEVPQPQGIEHHFSHQRIAIASPMECGCWPRCAAWR